jgi:hypothetical protein
MTFEGRTRMHTMNCQGGTRFHYNSDLSVDVSVVVPGIEGQRLSVFIPGADILAFVAEYVRDQRRDQIEDASDAEILGVSVPDVEDTSGD